MRTLILAIFQWDWLLEKVAAPAVMLLVGAYLKGVYDLKFKRIDEATQIRGELRAEIENLKKETQGIRAFRIKYEDSRALVADFDIACSRCVSRLEECVEVINCLLEAEDSLDKGYVRKARTILRLIENDKGMRAQMNLDARMKCED